MTSLLALLAISQVAPSFHGFYRAITSTPFVWTVSEWSQLGDHMAFLFTSNIPEHFNKLVLDALDVEDLGDESSEHFIKIFLSRYLAMGRPLTGYFMICCVVELQWTVLSQAISPIPPDELSSKVVDDALASNAAWLALTKQPASSAGDRTPAEKASLIETINGSLQLFYELLTQVQEMDPDSTIDTYAWETMAESLVCR